MLIRPVAEPDQFFASGIFLPPKLMPTHLSIVQMCCCCDSNVSCRLVTGQGQDYNAVGISGTYRYQGRKPVPADSTFARVRAFPVLVKANNICSLQNLNLSSMARHVVRSRVDRITVEVIIYEDHLFNTVEPCPGILVIWHVG